MVTSLNSQGTQKITVSMPIEMLARLDELLAPRQRSQFIVEAIERQIALAEQVAVLEETAGAWKDENRPDVRTTEHIDRGLTDLRTGRLGQATATETTTNGEHLAG